MIIKRLISIICICSLICGMGTMVFAEDNTIAVLHEFGTENAWKKVAVQVIAPGGNADSITDSTAEELIDYADVVETDSKGKLEFTYKPGKDGGIFIVRFNCGGELVEKEVVYFSLAEKNEYLNTVKTFEDIEDLFTEKSDDIWGYERLGVQNIESFGLYERKLNSESKTQVWQYLYDNLDEIETVDDFYMFFDDAVLQMLFKSAKTSEEWNGYIDVLNARLNFEPTSEYFTLYDTTLYTSASKAYAAEVFDSNGVISTETLKSAIEDAILLGAFAGASSYTVVNDIILAGEKRLIDAGADFDAYKDLKSKISVHKGLKGGTFGTITALTDALNKLVEEAERKGNNDNQSSGGSSGGGYRTPVSFEQNVQQENIKNSDETIVAEQKKAIKFKDVENHWAEPAIQKLADDGVVSGREAGLFYPDDIVTREEFVKMLTVYFNIPLVNGSTSFSDVILDDWYYTYIASAEKLNLVKGYNGRFGVGDKISRQDAAVMLYRFAEYAGRNFGETDELIFTDNNAIKEYAKDAVAALTESDIISGFEDGSFRPEDSITRAQAAKLLYEMGGISNEGE